MGLILERSGMAERPAETIGQLFGPVRGGLAFAVIFVGALLAATTGVVAASVISMGLISLPIMLRYGYDRRIASGVIAASGTLAQIIPPSLVLIILADQLGRSVGDMYKGRVHPGFLLTGHVCGLDHPGCDLQKPAMVPALPWKRASVREDNGRAVFCPWVCSRPCATRWQSSLASTMPTSTAGSKATRSIAWPRTRTIVVAMCGVTLAFVMAVLNKSPSWACSRAWPSA